MGLTFVRVAIGAVCKNLNRALLPERKDDRRAGAVCDALGISQGAVIADKRVAAALGRTRDLAHLFAAKKRKNGNSGIGLHQNNAEAPCALLRQPPVQI